MSNRDYSLYILRCGDGSLYTGIAIDVAKRLREHTRCRRGAKYLRGRGPFELVFRLAIGDRGTAMAVEHRVKQLDRPQKEALVAGRLSLEDCLGAAAPVSPQASGVAGG